MPYLNSSLFEPTGIKLETEIEEIKTNKIFENAFEWRFKFPEVLNDDGDFVGFDVVIGNPPYMRVQEIQTSQPIQKLHCESQEEKADTTELETQIDQLVYKLYNLTEEEINIIENS